jgi:hypothetical protein
VLAYSSSKVPMPLSSKAPVPFFQFLSPSAPLKRIVSIILDVSYSPSLFKKSSLSVNKLLILLYHYLSTLSDCLSNSILLFNPTISKISKLNPFEPNVLDKLLKNSTS